MALRTVLALTLAVLLGAASARAQMGPPGGGPGQQIEKYFQQIGMPKEFTANVEMQAHGMNMQSKMAIKADKSRMEMSGMGPMGQMIVITDGQAKKSYMLFPASKTYMEMPQHGPQAQQQDKAKEPKVTIKELGEEQKEGHPCTKRLITITGEGPQQSAEMTVWNATDMQNLPVRMEMGSGDKVVAMVFKDYDVNSPADSLFQVPADYKKQAGFGMPGMMPPGRGGGADDRKDD